MKEKTSASSRRDETEYFSLKDFYSKCAEHWKWFALSVILFMLLGAFYCVTRQPSYNRYTEVLIKDQENAGGVDFSNAFATFGFGGGNTLVNNELITFQSPAIMLEVVKRLTLTMNYVERGIPHGTTLYGKTQPFLISFADLEEDQGATMRMRLNPDGSGELLKFRTSIQGKTKKYNDVVPFKSGQTVIQTPLGRVTMVPNPECAEHYPEEEPVEIKVIRLGLQSAVELYCSKLKVDLVDQEAEVIKLSIDDVSKARANDILNAIIDIYNSNWIENRNLMAVSTSKFIDDRLKVIEEELGIVDSDISDFQARHRVIDPRQMAEAQMSVNANIEENLLQLHNELAMSSFLREYMANPGNRFSVVPVNTGLGSQQLEAQIANYNQLLLARNSLVENSSATNPLVVDYDHQLEGMREAIVKAVIAREAQLNASLRTMQTAHNQTQSQMASTPEQAKYLQTVGRQQRVKESLYLYLLEKREENDLSQSFTAYNTRVITPPSGPIAPVSPKVPTILFIACALGVIVPATFIYVKSSSDTKVHSRKDLERSSVPFAGELPAISKPRKLSDLFMSTKRRKEKAEEPLKVIEQGKRDIPNEAFRVVRSNLEFMMGRDSGSQIVMLTSLNPGSGKSFIGYNLAHTFALKGKRVLLIDGDLRRGTTSTYVSSPSKGLTTYLTQRESDWHKLIVSTEVKGLDVMGMGPMPPNPAELLDTDIFERLLRELRKDYDIIIIDCPPIDLVVDTQIIAQHVDRTIFVVRAGLLERGAIVEIDQLYADHKYKNMCLVLNGTESKDSRYGSYGNSSYGSYGS
ncbi:MAG: polysaccharide biosynthesis tyrosine autokinase [Bacteroides sp.]|nr:polysaccharide biosynthesis tyrosine autokinase [Bacteroides sp.]MDE7189341.1 polysaccharide biosynthesis tyrosine autokinase [Muribaculaceae bacterium]